MPDTFFAADVHLGMDSTRRQQTLIDFLSYVRSCRGNLYLLGDFFDFWANNRAMLRSMLPVLESLRSVSATGTTVGFIYGNRDFLVRPDTLSPFGITWLGEQADIMLGSLLVHITHGYTMCLNDAPFLAYQRYVWPLSRLLDRLLPGMIANYIVRRFILRSKESFVDQQKAQGSRFEFTREAIETCFRRGIDVVICGHTHEEEYFSSGQNQFFALGGWDEALGPYLVHRDGMFIRETFTAS
jgi:UDP-2,3-diacylglucosamine hydrolase